MQWLVILLNGYKNAQNLIWMTLNWQFFEKKIQKSPSGWRFDSRDPNGFRWLGALSPDFLLWRPYVARVCSAPSSKTTFFWQKNLIFVQAPSPSAKSLLCLKQTYFHHFVRTSCLSKATVFLLNRHSVKIRQIVLILSKITLLKDQIVSKNMLRPIETLLIWFLDHYNAKLPTPGIDRERCSTLDSQVWCLQKIFVKYMCVTFLKFKLR